MGVLCPRKVAKTALIFHGNKRAQIVGGGNLAERGTNSSGKNPAPDGAGPRFFLAKKMSPCTTLKLDPGSLPGRAFPGKGGLKTPEILGEKSIGRIGLSFWGGKLAGLMGKTRLLGPIRAWPFASSRL